MLLFVTFANIRMRMFVPQTSQDADLHYSPPVEIVPLKVDFRIIFTMVGIANEIIGVMLVLPNFLQTYKKGFKM